MIVKKITNDSISLKTPAKINLFLEVLNKRPDGFHNINSVFQAISLYDQLEFKLINQPIITIEITNGKILPVDNDNLIAKAFHLMKTNYKFDGGISVILEKNIPIAAGLGGGSSDAAATILACNYLFEIGLTYPEMAEFSAQIGSDLPFFFSNGQAHVTGRGEIIKEIKLPLDYKILLIKPSFSISTAEAYSKLKRGLTNSKTLFSLPCNLTSEDLISSLKSPGNDFEEISINSFPEMKRVYIELSKMGAKLVRMSGSGPTVFCIFDKTSTDLLTELNSMSKWGDWQLFEATPINLDRRILNSMGGARGDH